MSVQHLLQSAFLPVVERSTRSRFWSSYRQSVRFDHWPAQRREAYQRQRLSALLNIALHSSLQTERLKQGGRAIAPVSADEARALLEGLRPVTKSELRKHFPEGVTTGVRADDWRYLATAGTTDRMTVIADFQKRDHVRSSELRLRHVIMNGDVGAKSIEIAPNACNVVCGVNEVGPPTFLGYLWHSLRAWTIFSAQARSDLRGRFERQVVLPRMILPPIEPAPLAQLAGVLDGHLAAITKERPALMRAFPTYLLWLADRLRESGRKIDGLRLVGPYGGLTSPHMARRIALGFGVRFMNVYGTSELGPVAAACGHEPGMHIFEDLFLVEVLQKCGFAPPGQLGRLVITDLTNTIMPLIRYDVGDAVKMHLGPCSCGRQTPRLEVLGRIQEVLETPSGPLAASEVADTFFADPLIANCRLEETAPGSFEAAVVSGRAGGVPNVEAWKERFASLHTRVVKLRVRIVPFIRPEPSGKYRFVHPYTKGGCSL